MGIPAWAVRGAKVVCQPPDSGGWVGADQKGRPSIEPQRGSVYTISEVVLEFVPYLVLAECDPDDMFRLICFRPAVEPKTEAEDVAMFRDLIDQRQPEKADA